MAIFRTFLPLNNSLIQFNPFPLELSKRCLCAFQHRYLNYIYFQLFYVICFCAHFKPDLHQPSGLWSTLKQRHHARLHVSLLNPASYLFHSYGKWSLSGESDLKTTPSCQRGITVMISTAPFGYTLLVFICSLIFWTTIMRTWSCDYFLNVYGQSCSELQPSGLRRRLQVSQ